MTRLFVTLLHWLNLPGPIADGQAQPLKGDQLARCRLSVDVEDGALKWTRRFSKLRFAGWPELAGEAWCSRRFGNRLWPNLRHQAAGFEGDWPAVRTRQGGGDFGPHLRTTGNRAASHIQCTGKFRLPVDNMLDKPKTTFSLLHSFLKTLLVFRF